MARNEQLCRVLQEGKRRRTLRRTACATANATARGACRNVDKRSVRRRSPAGLGPRGVHVQRARGGNAPMRVYKELATQPLPPKPRRVTTMEIPHLPEPAKTLLNELRVTLEECLAPLCRENEGEGRNGCVQGTASRLDRHAGQRLRQLRRGMRRSAPGDNDAAPPRHEPRIQAMAWSDQRRTLAGTNTALVGRSR